MRLMLAAALLTMAGCASHPDGRRFGPPPGGPGMRPPGMRGGGLFISPMGEPFRGEGGREASIARWFDGADTSHDGKLSLTEFQQDAQRFFKTLDTDQDGEIAPAELDHYETEIVPEIRMGDSFGGGGGGGGDRPRGGRGGHGGRGGGGMGGGGMGGGAGMGSGLGGPDGGGDMSGRGAGRRQSGGGPGGGMGARGAARFGFLDLPEPVASADADMNRGVTVAEFAAAAATRFMLLDADHDGKITLAELPQLGHVPPR